MATSRYPRFDMSRVMTRPLSDRADLVTRDKILPLDVLVNHEQRQHPVMQQLVRAVRNARGRDKPVILFIGGHVVKDGMSAIIGDLVSRKMVTHLAMNGAAFIHDFELSTRGSTSERVEDTLPSGKFGLWHETLDGINQLIRIAYAMETGLGEAAGDSALSAVIASSKGWNTRSMYSIEYANTSLAYKAYEADVPLTIHSGPIGADIFHLSPGFHPERFGQVAHCDWLAFVEAVSNLGDGGVFINMGSAVVGPELFVKALSLARNAKRDEGGVQGFTTSVFDIKPLRATHNDWDPEPNEPGYYNRWLKNVLKRPVAESGIGIYVCGRFRDTVPAFRAAISE